MKVSGLFMVVLLSGQACFAGEVTLSFQDLAKAQLGTLDRFVLEEEVSAELKLRPSQVAVISKGLSPTTGQSQLKLAGMTMDSRRWKGMGFQAQQDFLAEAISRLNAWVTRRNREIRKVLDEDQFLRAEQLLFQRHVHRGEWKTACNVAGIDPDGRAEQIANALGKAEQRVLDDMAKVRYYWTTRAASKATGLDVRELAGEPFTFPDETRSAPGGRRRPRL